MKENNTLELGFFDPITEFERENVKNILNPEKLFSKDSLKDIKPGD